MNKLIFHILITLVVTIAYGQTPKSTMRDYRKNPRWIQMMEDSTVNYHQAVIAFDEFWKGKPEPEGELEGNEHEEHEERSLLSRLLKSDDKLKEEVMQYASEFKRFRYWKRKYAAYVRSDGSIPTEEDIKKLIEQEIINRR